MIVHRDYQNTGDSIIKIYDTKNEFYNPGKLENGLTIADLKSGSYTSYARNRKVADVFREAGIIEKYGSGIQRITNAFISYGLQEPVFEEFQNGFRVTVFNNTNTNINDAGINEGLNGGLNEGLNSMLTAIIQNPAIQAKQLSNILEDRPLKTIERQIKSLTDKGYIERKGSKKTGGYYVVKD